MFSNSELRNLSVPLFIEQFLLMFVDIADTFVVGFTNGAAVSGVSPCRSTRKANVTLYIPIAANVINVISQCAGVFGPHMDAARATAANF